MIKVVKRFLYFSFLTVFYALWGFLRDCIVVPLRLLLSLYRKLRHKVMEKTKPTIQKDPETGEEKVLLDGRLYTTSEVFEAYHLALDIRLRAMRSRKGPKN